MVPGPVFQLLLFGLLSSARPAAGNENHLLTAPHPQAVEIGTNFTATCMIINTSEVTADDLYWNVSQKTIPKEQYTKVNETALNVTLQITGEKAEWLFCLCRKVSLNVVLNQGRFMHGIYLRKGYPPRQPVNLSCIALQEKSRYISPTITCSWETVGLQTQEVATKYTLVLNVIGVSTHNVSTEGNSASVTRDIFPDFMEVEVWVEAQNKLGTIVSEHLKKEAGYFVKTNPPSNTQVMSEKSFPTSLLLTWTRLIIKQYGLIYEIRFCQNGSHDWTYVPLADTSRDIQSFRLQNLQPDTVYITQVRCKLDKVGYGYWSEWSTNTTNRTPEDRPGKPELWQIITEVEDRNERRVQFICKDPLFPNGRILSFEMKIQDQMAKVQNGSVEWESIPVNRSDSSSGQRTITSLKTIDLSDKRSVKVFVSTVNSVGRSPEASLFIPDKTHELAPVEELRVWPHEGQLWLEWKPPSSAPVTEYVVEWVTGDVTDWQRENRSTRQTAIRGDVKRFVCYTVSVYPIYSGWTGRPTSVQAFLEQGAPLSGPVVRLRGKPGHNKAELVWTQIPPSSRQGFIINYTIFYTSGDKTLTITVPANTTSYTLTSLSSNTKYDTWVSASTIRGSTEGYKHSFTTLKYAPGQIEFIVVGVSLSFLFVVVMTMLLCIYKKDAIKKNFWPQIPDPGESTLGNWSPDYPLKAETPKENCLSGISVLDVDVCEGKSVFEEDKASLALKKDKYLSEEHSSGIGGSSCMSSPRQSVSDSDEGGDMADTTASTVQYSSVVASNGYKGQTPSSQAQQAIFSRSESTQPLLESEENPDMMVQEGSRQSQRFLQQPSSTMRNPADFNQLLEMQQQEVLEPLEFCSLEEDSEQTPTEEQSADWLSAGPVSSYMPQRGGYRPQ